MYVVVEPAFPGNPTEFYLVTELQSLMDYISRNADLSWVREAVTYADAVEETVRLNVGEDPSIFIAHVHNILGVDSENESG